MITSTEYHTHRITQLKMDIILYVVMSATMLLLCVVLTSFLPQLLAHYVYTSNKQATEFNRAVGAIYATATTLGLGFCLFAVVKNIMQYQKIWSHEAELNMLLTPGTSTTNSQSVKVSASTKTSVRSKKRVAKKRSTKR